MKVQPGEFIAVVGPSGCGKSTLMKLLSGLWPASDGTVIVDGSEVTGPLSIASMAFQNPTLLPWRSVLRNVLLPLESSAAIAASYDASVPPMRPRPSNCSRSSVSQASRAAHRGSSPAACSSASRAMYLIAAFIEKRMTGWTMRTEPSTAAATASPG